MKAKPPAKYKNLGLVVLGLVFAAAVAGVLWRWKQQQAMNELVGAGLRLINYTDHDVYTSVRNARFPNPGEGASYDMGPHAGGGGVMCCVPIPVIWRPGIKMNVWYSFAGSDPQSGQTKIVELPEYPDGRPGSLYLVFHSDTEFELLSSIFAPGHPRWHGRQIEPVIEGLK